MWRALLPLVLVFSSTIAGAQPSGAVLAERGWWKELRAMATERVEANPNDAEAQWLLSRALTAFHDVDGALKPAERAVALAPNRADYAWQLAQVYGEQAERAGILRQLGLARKFKQETEAALALDPNLVDALMGLMEYCERAPAIAGGNTHRVEQLENRLGAISKADGLLARIRLLRLRKPPPSTAQLEQLYAQVVQADAHRYEPHVELANLYASETPPRLGLAASEAAGARAIDPERIDAYRLLARIHATTGSFERLDADLTAAQTRVPGDVSPWLAAAVALRGAGNELQRAEHYARKYLGVEPEPDEPTPAFAHWQLGLILEKEGRISEAIGELETAVRLEPILDGARADLKRLRARS